mmetsp:Transcript_33935/g.54214  ORF Transcript_33935/g.54214 Transcript_33935/m.54214 type:complete len:137 (+) Transcript_33935:57-467(+)
MRSHNKSDEAAMQALLAAQDEELPHVVAELERGHKQSCWIWYVCPTSRPGMCDPRGVYVTPSTAKELFADKERSAQWQKALELICDQVDNDGMKAIPRIDQGRIHYFIKEWKEIDHGSDWMTKVLKRLDEFDWPPR